MENNTIKFYERSGHKRAKEVLRDWQDSIDHDVRREEKKSKTSSKRTEAAAKSKLVTL